MVFTKAQAKSLAILDVARSLGMEMKRSSNKEYYWTEHDSFKIDIMKNTWHWYSKGLFGDTINLVQEMRNVSYKDAMTFLETGDFPEASLVQEERQPFVYRLQQYEKPFVEAREYLKEQRGLSDETIDFFVSKGVLAQARYQSKDGYQEDVLVFKYLNKQGQIVGASLQGLAPNKERYEGKGYLKQILYGSEGIAGLNVSIGTPERLVVAEAPIDLMSYYELHKGGLEDVRLVAMEGLKEGVLSRYSLELLQERGILEQEYRDYTKASDLAATSRFLSLAAQRSTFFQDHPLDDFITLAVDNDKAGTDFLENLREKNIPIIDARPPKGDSEEKIDWNAYLKEQKGGDIMENTYQKQVDDLISDMTKDDTNYYLWHDEELNTMDAGDTILEEFHSGLEDVRYEIAGATLYVEESINDGATGYLSLEGHSLDDSGIRDYLSDKGLSGAAAVEFLTKLKVELSEIWNKVVNHYNKQLEKIIEKYGLTPEITSGVKEKALDRNQELYSNAGDSHRNPDFLGGSSPGAASKPVVDEPQPDFPVIAPLQFTTKGEWMSTLKPGYHVITDGELKRLNKFAPGLQATAQWYLKELSGSVITYLYQDREGIGRLDVQFSDENFAHLTGISPKGVEMKQVVYDFASGQGDYENIQVSHAIKDKSMVLPLLPDIISSQAFVFNDLSTVEKFHKIDLAQAIQTEDEDLLLALRDVDGIGVPASMMRIKDKLSVELAGKEKVILGVYRERSGHLEQLSINDKLVKDDGKEMMSILSKEQYPKGFSEEKFGNNRRLHDQKDSDSDGISDEEELLQGTNPFDFRSQPGTKQSKEIEVQEEAEMLVAGTSVVAELIKNQDIVGLNRHLKEGIRDYLDSDKYKDYLTKMSQLNNYSSRNLRLILAQNPEATQVASFKQWKETFGRHVKKGEKSLRIFAPMTKIKKDDNNQPVLDKNGNPETVTFFGLVPVFDVSQTDGKEMPKAATVKEQLTDLDYANLYRALMTVAKANDVSVRFEEMADSRKGYYSVTENQIVLRSNDMNKSQIIKTFLHETAHSELHHADNPQQEQLTRSTAELQAESVAYVVASYYGIDTSEYSFDYLAGWSNDKETLADLEAQLDIVQQEAKSLIVRMDQTLEQLRLAQTKKASQHFEQKLQKFKDKTDQVIVEQKQEQQSKKEKGFSK